jgi:glucose-1-phosphate thymidylyltransferase
MLLKGIILAGGTSSRLYPLTKLYTKHLLPVGKYPMIIHAVHKLRQADINDILIISDRQQTGNIIQLLGSGEEYNVTLTYRIQEESCGIAHALEVAENFVHDEPILVLLGDNIFSENLSPYVESFKNQNKGAKVILKQVEAPCRYGVPEFVDNKIVGIEEKPVIPKSSYAVTGIYMYDTQVFDIIKTITPSKRGELEITDVNNTYINNNQLTFDILHGWWLDAGTHDSLFLANQLAREIDWNND